MTDQKNTHLIEQLLEDSLSDAIDPKPAPLPPYTPERAALIAHLLLVFKELGEMQYEMELAELDAIPDFGSLNRQIEELWPKLSYLLDDLYCHAPPLSRSS